MRIARIALMVLGCAGLMACVTQRETIPPSTRVELLRLGRILTDENEAEETRSNAQISYCNLVRETIKKHGKKSVNRQVILDSFMVNGRKPNGLSIDDGMLDYMFECKDGTLAIMTILFGGWTGSYVQAAYSGAGIP